MLYQRNFRLYTPSDFDYSPYFEIIKYPIFELSEQSMYRDLPWSEEGMFSHEYEELENAEDAESESKDDKNTSEKVMGRI